VPKFCDKLYTSSLPITKFLLSFLHFSIWVIADVFACVTTTACFKDQDSTVNDVSIKCVVSNLKNLY